MSPIANPITDGGVNFVTTPNGSGGGSRTTGPRTASNGQNVSATVGGIVLAAAVTIFVLHMLGFRFAWTAGMRIGG